MNLISPEGIIQEIIPKIPGLKKKHVMPFAIFDIDGTILDPFPRQLAVYEEILSPKFNLPPVHELDVRSKPYFIGDLLPELKKDSGKYKQVVEEFLEHFLSPQYLHLDLAYPGATAFVAELRKLGLGIIYLTSRHLNGKNSMADDTIQTMCDLGFPIGPSTEVLFGFKTKISDDDFEFKRKFAQKFAANKFQDCLFFIDNETKMCQIFREELPQALIVRFESAQSQDLPFEGLTITSWENSK